MDSRERVELALNHDEPDRVPRDFWASSGAWQTIMRSTGMTRDQFLDHHDIDLRYIEGPAYVGAPLADGVDIWGVRRRISVVETAHGTEQYSEVSGSPLKDLNTVDAIESYGGWPDPDDFDYSVVRDQAAAVHDQGRFAVFMGDRLNRIAQLKPAMYLRGVEQILVDLAANPEIARAIIGRIGSFYREYLIRILESAKGLIDIVLTGDDFGEQRGLLVSEEMWSQFLAPGFAEYMDIINDCGVRTMHHTCGDVSALAPQMHRLGLDILQSLQPEAMSESYGKLKRQLGQTMSFHGGLSIQKTLPHGTPAEIENEVQDRVRTLGQGGGYILCTAHNIQADSSYRNVKSLLEAYATRGRYD